MNEIKCPSCERVFKVDESGFADIVRQVRNEEFAREMRAERARWEEFKRGEMALAEANLRNTLQGEMARKESVIVGLQKEIEAFAIKERLAVKEAEDGYKGQVDFLKGEIASLKEHKAKQNVKMLGESLEQHCEISFNQWCQSRNIVFEKDTRGDSRGDYIYREFDEGGVEILSIMFEMKNEEDEKMTAGKKNVDFLEKLNKDRLAKKCEYAVLVSTLEKGNDFYDSGMVDMSRYFDKMYVIRPQFFIPIITVLRSAAFNLISSKRELAIAKNQNIDILNFEENINKFKNEFSENYRRASVNFDKAIKEIDDTIKGLEGIKEYLRLTGKNLRLANDKADDLTVKKLTHNAPMVREMFLNKSV
jgi:hypothetical protein